MPDQSNHSRRKFPGIAASMQDAEVADYCHTMGWNSDPVVAVLLERLSSKPGPYERKLKEEVFQKMAIAFDDQAFAESMQMVKILGQRKPRPGPKDKYLPKIVLLLDRQGPLKRSELVEKVLRLYPDAGKGAIYRAIAKAVEDRKITALDNVFHSPR